MSWSISFIGRPEKVVEALEGYVAKSGISGPSAEEYEKALPLMVGIVQQNFGNEGELVQVSASGSGTYVGGEPKNSRCNVKIDNIWGVLV